MRSGILAAAMLVIILGLGGATWLFVSGVARQAPDFGGDIGELAGAAMGADEPHDPSGAPRRFRVERGETAASIAERLERAGIIGSALAFRLRARTEGVDVRFEAGEYELSPAMRPSEIMARLQRGRFASEELTIPEGWRLAQIADAIEAKVPGSREDFLRIASTYRSDHTLLKDRPAEATLEGYLFPDTYHVDRDTGMAKLTDAMVRRFAEKVTPDIVDRARQRGLDVHRLVTLASVVEREAQVPSERPTIAAVFLNRLRQGMPLQADPTVQFALRPTNAPSPGGSYWKAELSSTDLRIASPYNTYQNRGLPPGPICSPGIDAIRAVAEAEPSDLLYFVARPDGSHAFARTLAEHNANVAKVVGGR